MFSRNVTIALMVAVGSLGSPVVRASDSASDKTSQLGRQVPGAEATIEMICDQAVKNIAMRYNLNETQTATTNALMKREVDKFLREHENEIWPLMRSMLATQLAAKPPDDPAELRRLGKAARPLVQLAKDAIFTANEEWREILTPEQKRVHDFDLGEMEKTFEKIDQNFSSWAEGVPKDNPLFPPAGQIPEGSPPRPSRPAEGMPPRVDTPNLTIFDTFVEEFIKDYELNEGQIDTARSILKEFKEKAGVITSAKKEEFAKIATEREAATKNVDRAKIAELEQEYKKLLDPVYQLFGQMEERLKGLLNSAQLEQYTAKHQATEPGADKEATVTKEPPGKTPPRKPTASKKSATGKPEPAQRNENENASKGATKPDSAQRKKNEGKNAAKPEAAQRTENENENKNEDEG